MDSRSAFWAWIISLERHLTRDLAPSSLPASRGLCTTGCHIVGCRPNWGSCKNLSRGRRWAAPWATVSGVGVPVMIHLRSALMQHAIWSLLVIPRLLPSECPSSRIILSQCTRIRLEFSALTVHSTLSTLKVVMTTSKFHASSWASSSLSLSSNTWILSSPSSQHLSSWLHHCCTRCAGTTTRVAQERKTLSTSIWNWLRSLIANFRASWSKARPSPTHLGWIHVCGVEADSLDSPIFSKYMP
mmetsp:Transcript_4679/g.16411  ORF Transcript_4679/g.16411 Transcript_4679/m.16411 type:complete len:243 (-) Transcript_4679:1820-2548(-)